MLKSVLIIEDEVGLRDILVEEMAASGYKPLVASNGREGLDVILTQEPDLVICDRAMPHMSGFELLRRLRGSFPQYKDMPFIFLTCLADERDRIAAEELNPSAYLTKPVDFNALQKTVLKAMGQKSSANA